MGARASFAGWCADDGRLSARAAGFSQREVTERAATVPRPRADAAERILRAAIRRIVTSGAAALTMHEVSEEAGVSKGLIHYHFHDKETLLARMVEWMTRSLVARERAALAESIPRHAIDDLWKWLESELERGQIRVLLELAEWRGRSCRARSAIRPLRGAMPRRHRSSICSRCSGFVRGSLHRCSPMSWWRSSTGWRLRSGSTGRRMRGRRSMCSGSRS